MDMFFTDTLLMTRTERIIPVIAGARMVSTLAVGQLEQKAV